ncbi:MAG: hypothetical protein JWR75_869 [Devosia sp.]|nr:hypothetical protein [Devosia sp.]
MTIATPTDIAVVTTGENTQSGSYVEWAAIFAGIVVAAAISLLLLTFGSAIGLSFTNFSAGPDVNPVFIAIAAATWLLLVQVSSYMAGGYIAGRLRRRFHDATEHESDIRDGLHGLIVWAGGTLLSAMIIASGVGAAANAVGSAAATAVEAGANAADSIDPNAYLVDTLYRPAPGTGGTTVFNDTTAQRDEAGRIFGAVSDGSISDADKAYLVQSVAANTGLPEADAQARVDQAVTAFDDAKAKAAAAAETARKTAVLAAFLTAAALLVSAAAAWWAAMSGGNHRDKQVVFAGFGRF